MNKYLKFMPVALLAGLAAVGTACSDDKDEPDPNPNPGTGTGEATANVNPATVFTQGVPAQVGDLLITKNEAGLVTKIVDNEEVMTFDYTGSGKTKSRSVVNIPTTYDMTMNYDSDGDGRVDDIFYVTLTSQGYIEYAYQLKKGDPDDGGDSFDEWWFKYDTNGRMTEMKRSEGDNEVTTITYNADGDIVDVKVVDDYSNRHHTVISYTNTATTAAIANKGGIMLFDDTFRIDMDEMEIAYYAGLLGKATTNLPVAATEDGDEFYTFTWTLNSNNLPVKLETLMKASWGSDTDVMTFKW